MARKYLNRPNDPKDVSADDEWAHITDLAGKETKIEAKDVLDVQDRSITFGEEEQEKSGFEKLKESARLAMDAAGNTGQYIKYVNNHIDIQNKEIEKIKKIKEKFDKEVDLLKTHKIEKPKVDKNSSKEVDIQTVTDYLHQLLSEKGYTKRKLDKLKNEMETIEDEIQDQEQQIEQVNEELEEKQSLMDIKKNKQTKKIESELRGLVEKYGVDSLSEVLDSVKSSQNSD